MVSRYCPVVAGKRAEGLLEMMLFIELYTLNPRVERAH